MFRILKTLAVFMSLAMIAPASACTIEHARYSYSVDKNVTLDFKNKGQLDGWLSPLALHLSLGAGKPNYWFLFDQGTARYTFLISTSDVDAPGWTPPTESNRKSPLGSMEYFSWRSALRVIEPVPKPGDIAPDVIFLPDLPERLAYQATPRVNIVPGLFRLASCRR